MLDRNMKRGEKNTAAELQRAHAADWAALLRIPLCLLVFGIFFATSMTLAVAILDVLRGSFGGEPWLTLPVLAAAAAVVVACELAPWPSEGPEVAEKPPTTGVLLLPVVGGIVGLALLQHAIPGKIEPSQPIGLLRLLVTDVVALAAFAGSNFKGVARRWYVALALVIAPTVPAVLAAAWVRFHVDDVATLAAGDATMFRIPGMFAILVLSTCPPFGQALYRRRFSW